MNTSAILVGRVSVGGVQSKRSLYSSIDGKELPADTASHPVELFRNGIEIEIGNSLTRSKQVIGRQRQAIAMAQVNMQNHYVFALDPQVKFAVTTDVARPSPMITQVLRTLVAVAPAAIARSASAPVMMVVIPVTQNASAPM